MLCSRTMYARWVAQVRWTGPELPPLPVAEEKDLPPGYSKHQACCLPPSYGDADRASTASMMPLATHPHPFPRRGRR